MWKKAIYATALSGLLVSTSLAQASDPVVQEIFDNLVSEGYTHVEVKKTINGYDVEASNDLAKTERRYGSDGSLKRQEDSLENDDDDDDHDDDDHDDDDDDHDDDDDDHDDDDDDHDDDDDDRDDDDDDRDDDDDDRDDD